MINDQKSGITFSKSKFDLEERTLIFAKKIIDLVNKLPKNIVNLELISQLVRSSGSIGANYREANQALGVKDFYMRVRISRKEAKETKFWLELISHNNPNFTAIIIPLISESEEYVKIFSTIVKKYYK